MMWHDGIVWRTTSDGATTWLDGARATASQGLSHIPRIPEMSSAIIGGSRRHMLLRVAGTGSRIPE